jgi:hypothetical protein
MARSGADEVAALLRQHAGNRLRVVAIGYGPMSVIADLDGDGRQEIIAGNTAYRSDGTLMWKFLMPPGLDVDGLPIVIDTDGDGAPEIVLRTRTEEIVVLNHDGTIQHGPWYLPSFDGCPAPFAAHDFDGDGLPELAIPAGSIFHVLEADGTPLWEQPINDFGGQCGAAGVAAFDFEGDGRAEVVYADATTQYIFRGTDGLIIFNTPRSSETLYETPVIADVDRDGHADILFTQWSWPGLKLVNNTNNDWVGTRPIWNQHSYHVTNIASNGSVPINEGAGWARFNAYRSNEAFCR